MGAVRRSGRSRVPRLPGQSDFVNCAAVLVGRTNNSRWSSNPCGPTFACEVARAFASLSSVHPAEAERSVLFDAHDSGQWKELKIELHDLLWAFFRRVDREQFLTKLPQAFLESDHAVLANAQSER